jgi:hypothetical protein
MYVYSTVRVVVKVKVYKLKKNGVVEHRQGQHTMFKIWAHALAGFMFCNIHTFISLGSRIFSTPIMELGV